MTYGPIFWLSIAFWVLNVVQFYLNRRVRKTLDEYRALLDLRARLAEEAERGMFRRQGRGPE